MSDQNLIEKVQQKCNPEQAKWVPLCVKISNLDKNSLEEMMSSCLRRLSENDVDIAETIFTELENGIRVGKELQEAMMGTQ